MLGSHNNRKKNKQSETKSREMYCQRRDPKSNEQTIDRYNVWKEFIKPLGTFRRV